MRDKYTGVNFPKELIKEVDDIIKEKKHGYSSRAEFIKEAIRLRMKEINKKNQE